MKLYIAYGSNLNCAQMRYRCPDAFVLADRKLQGYELVFRGNSKGNGVLTIEKNPKTSVPVGIWAISDEDERNLDAYEGYPWLYRKEFLPVEYKGKPYRALVYIMNEAGHDITPPNKFYLGTCIEGYKNFGFDITPLSDAALNALSHTHRLRQESLFVGA